jgi:L-lactate transport
MWQQNYTPVGNSLGWSALVAALPVLALLYAIGIRRVTAWKASILGLATAALVAAFAYHMPPVLIVNSAIYGAAFGAFPIFWIIYWAILLYRITVDTGQFEILKESIGHLTTDQSLQALLIGFAFGAFLEGAAGFGTPVAVAAAILSGLGFSAFYASGICLLANTAPVAFGSIGIPLVTLAATTNLPINDLSANVGRICAPLSLIIPAYLVMVMGGLKGLRRVWPAALTCGVSFGGVQFLTSNFIGPYLTDILGSLAAIGSLVVLLHFWRPAETAEMVEAQERVSAPGIRPHGLTIARAWSPYFLLIVFILIWSLDGVKSEFTKVSWVFGWPGLHNIVQQTSPVVSKPTPYPALYRLRWLAESGTACAFSAIAAALFLRVRPRRLGQLAVLSGRQLTFSFISVTTVLALAFLMNYSGATGTLGLAFATSGRAFPFFSALLGWLGVFLTGSDTSANALFGNLQKITAQSLGLKPALMAAANSAGGVMGKMISLQSIAVAAAAAGLKPEDEPKLFRFTLRHSILLASLIGLLTLAYAYVFPQFAR